MSQLLQSQPSFRVKNGLRKNRVRVDCDANARTETQYDDRPPELSRLFGAAGPTAIATICLSRAHRNYRQGKKDDPQLRLRDFGSHGLRPQLALLHRPPPWPHARRPHDKRAARAAFNVRLLKKKSLRVRSMGSRLTACTSCCVQRLRATYSP